MTTREAWTPCSVCFRQIRVRVPTERVIDTDGTPMLRVKIEAIRVAADLHEAQCDGC